MQFLNSRRVHQSTVQSPQQFVKRQGWKAAGRALISGYVDSYTLLNFGVYASFMSGNTTSAGLHIGQANLSAAAHSLLPIPLFVLGIFAGTLLIHAEPQHSLTWLSLLIAAMLTIGVAASYFAWPGWASILVLSTAMGIMNTTITHVGSQSVSLGFVTGNLNNLGQHLAMGINRAPVSQKQGSWDTHWLRAAVLAGIWTAFLLGAELGAAFAARLANWTLLLPALMLVVLALLDPASI
jgi:uncharacterized membrane protein YoaK (UPF0700 family)